MTDSPTTRYVKSGDYSIAYQVVGEGDVDLILVSGWVSHLEVDWEGSPVSPSTTAACKTSVAFPTGGAHSPWPSRRYNPSRG